MSLFSPLVNVAKFVIGAAGKMKVTDFVLELVGYIPSVIRSITETIDMKKDGVTVDEKKRIVDSALEEFDRMTGLEGLSLTGDIDLRTQEIALDHLAEFMRVILYAKIGLRVNDQTVAHVTGEINSTPVNEANSDTTGAIS